VLSHPGLQTPRLKRLAEIVSQQAIAQQERLEYGSQVGEEAGDYDGQSFNDMTEVDEHEYEHEQDQQRPGSVAAGAA
jgi:myosin-5